MITAMKDGDTTVMLWDDETDKRGEWIKCDLGDMEICPDANGRENDELREPYC